MGRFETEWLTRPADLVALADLPGQWIDAVHQRRQPRVVVLDIGFALEKWRVPR
jgi:hypothetical protein